MKRVLSVLLICAMCFSSFSVTAFAAVTNEELYTKYPIYIVNNTQYNNLERETFRICTEILNSQEKSGKYEALLATLVDDGLSIGLQQFAAIFGFGASYEVSIQESATEKFLAAVSAENLQENEYNKKVASEAKKWMGVYKDFAGPFKKDEDLKNFLTQFLTSLGISSKKVPELQKVLTNKIPKIFTVGAQGVRAYQTILSLTAIYGYRMDSVKVLMSSVNKDSDLYKGLSYTLNEMKDPAKYFSNHYTSSAVLGVIGGWLEKNATKFFTGNVDSLVTGAWIYDLCKSLYFTFIYDGYKIDDYAEAVYLLAYLNDIDNAKNNLEIEFLNGTAKTADIPNHKKLVELSQIAQIAALNAFSGLLSLRNQLDLKTEAEGQASRLSWKGGYDWFMDECRKAVEADIASGKITVNTNKDPSPIPDLSDTIVPPKPENVPKQETLTVVSQVECLARIECPLRVVNLYRNPGDANRYTYFSKGQTPRSDIRVTMSDGSLWYKVNVSHEGASIDLWLKEEADMKITLVHTFEDVQYANAHPHGGYRSCKCGYSEYVEGGPFPDNCSQCRVATHTSHDWDTWTVTKYPTRTETGIKTYTCAVCAETKQEELPALTGISGEGSNGVEWTLTGDGVLSVCTDRDYLNRLTLNTGADQHYIDTVKTLIVEEGITKMETWVINTFPNLTCVILPNSLRTISGAIFRECPNLRNIYLPKGLCEIDSLFGGLTSICPNVESITVSEENECFTSVDGVLYTKDMTELVSFPSAKTSLRIPKSVTRIRRFAIPYEAALVNVSYEGSATDWEKISIEQQNVELPIEIEFLGESQTQQQVSGVDAMTDVGANDWYYDAVSFALENGIMSGYNASKFGPNDTLNRAMVVQVLYNKEGQPDLKGAKHNFSDVPSNQWFNNAVTWSSNRGVVSGFGGGVFKPEDAVTIEQVAVILRNYSGSPNRNGDLSKVGNYSDWAADALKWAVEAGILDNVPFSNATEKATRAQTAQMLTNYLRGN